MVPGSAAPVRRLASTTAPSALEAELARLTDTDRQAAARAGSTSPSEYIDEDAMRGCAAAYVL
jgi:hypothetical protein